MQWRIWLWLLPFTVPVSSFFGLLRPAVQFDISHAEVWGLNLWGDLVFTIGTIMATCISVVAVGRLHDRHGPRRAFWVGALGSLALHWIVYVLSWSFVIGADSEPFMTLGFTPQFVASFGGWFSLLQMGWPGLLAMALGVPGIVLATVHRGHTESDHVRTPGQRVAETDRDPSEETEVEWTEDVPEPRFLIDRVRRSQ